MKRISLVLATAFALTTSVDRAASATESVLYAFTGGGGFAFGKGAASPFSDMIADSSGTLFGTTNFGGDGCGSNGPGCGTVFSLTPPAPGKTAWTFKRLTTFSDGVTGAYPLAGLVMDAQGALYGTTTGGDTGISSSGGGTVFKLTPPAPGKSSWTRTVIYRFKGGSDGATPEGRLLLDPNGDLYGTTLRGGTDNNGTVFKLSPPAPGAANWTETVLYRFAGGTDGRQPASALYRDARGALYGTTTLGGGPNDLGAVFMVQPPATAGGAWTETVLYRFLGGSDGAFPAFSGLVSDAEGALYGTTLLGGGTANAGTAFKLTPPAPPKSVWKESVLHRFRGGADGERPNSGVVFDTNGNLVGTTIMGGPSNLGTAFRLAPPVPGTAAWRLTSLHGFTGGTDGSDLRGSLLVGNDGSLYGQSYQGGAGCPAITANGCGTVYKITP